MVSKETFAHEMSKHPSVMFEMEPDIDVYYELYLKSISGEKAHCQIAPMPGWAPIFAYICMVLGHGRDVVLFSGSPETHAENRQALARLLESGKGSAFNVTPTYSKNYSEIIRADRTTHFVWSMLGKLTGASCDHASLVLIDGAGDMDPLALQEARLVVAPKENAKPMIVEVW
ncbi:hypothetical protein UFOVP75_97 [uncultured Caudovirales phage]|uniref:Uncharacterized protein n=1 Tax=uncultured Caudovirales phage TaxID=2100421 RepID=A0A6J5L5S4_9CAUD|nr:hypothetical protein UFOVP75_97 [uncultured Caudovirales phage]